MNDLVSIIVPIFNCKKYIKKCIKSIINQSYENLEIILINDGSYDSSGEICDWFASRDPRIRVIQKKNGGVSSSRNAGLSIANGKYILFVDADDWLPGNSVDLLIRDNTDFCCGNAMQIVSYHSLLLNENIKEEKDYDIEEFKDFYCFFSSHMECWGKMFKSNIIRNNKLYFPEDMSIGEDEVFILNYLKYCDKITFIPDIVYYYNRLNENSILHKYYPNYPEWNYLHAYAFENLLSYISHNDERGKNYLILERYLHKWSMSCYEYIRSTKAQPYAECKKTLTDITEKYSPKIMFLSDVKEMKYLDCFYEYMTEGELTKMYNIVHERLENVRDIPYKAFVRKIICYFRYLLLYKFY